MGEWIFVLVVLSGIAYIYYLVVHADGGENDNVETELVKATTSPPNASDGNPLSNLHLLYYSLATIGGGVLLIYTVFNSDELSGAEVGYMIGWTFGSVLSMFAVGRVIQLLQQIRDAVRNIPALSPGRPDDE
jgi:hypothetical protein